MDSDRNGLVCVVESNEENQSIRSIDQEDTLTSFKPEDPHGIQGNIDEYQALMSLVKGSIGTGMLSMPVVFKYAGLWAGFFLIIGAGLLATYLMHVLLRTANAAQQRYNWDPAKMDYTETVFVVLKFGPLRLRKPKGKIKHTINGFLIVTQIGFCCVYTLFLTENIRFFLNSFFPTLRTNFALVAFLVCLCLIPLCISNNMRLFAYFSLLANVCTLIGILLIFSYLFTSGLKPVSSLPAITNARGILIAFSIVIFSFEGISLVLPIQSKMLDRTHYSTTFGVLNVGMLSVVCLNIATGFFGYLKFGAEAQGSITLNVPEVPYWFAPVKPLFILVILVSYTLQFYVPAVIFERLMEKLRCHREATPKRRFIHIKSMRVSLVFISYIAAITIPRLDLMISLIGSLAGSILSFILPASLELIYLWPDRHQIHLFWLTVFTKHMILIMVGLMSFVGGTVTTLMQLIDVFGS